MDPKVEISRIKRRRMGLLVLAGALALGGYRGWRAWSYARWEAALRARLPAVQQERAATQRHFLGAACAGRSAGSGNHLGSLPAGLTEILGRHDTPAEQRAALRGFRSQLIEALDPGSVESRLARGFEESPTFHLESFTDPLLGLGAWEFTRHLYDARGKALVYFPAGGFHEGVLDAAARLREDLELYDYVLSLDLPPRDTPCEPTFTRALAADFAARVLAEVESDAGGPVRRLALRSEGRLAPLFAALVNGRIAQVELTGILAADERGRAALTLALLGDRYLIVDAAALGDEALAELESALEILGQRENLEIR